MGDAGIRGGSPSREFTGGAYSNYKVRASPPGIRLVVTPEQMEFRARGLTRLFGRGPWVIPHDEVKEVFTKKGRSSFAPTAWNVEIATKDPSVWWTFWSSSPPEPLLLVLKEWGYPVNWDRAGTVIE